MKPVSVSIIVPVYNVEPYIKECFDSVANQTYRGPLECIFVDDCGTDDSVSILDSCLLGYKGHVDFRLVHHERNRGLSAARNTGLGGRRVITSISLIAMIPSLLIVYGSWLSM